MAERVKRQCDWCGEHFIETYSDFSLKRSWMGQIASIGEKHFCSNKCSHEYEMSQEQQQPTYHQESVAVPEVEEQRVVQHSDDNPNANLEREAQKLLDEVRSGKVKPVDSYAGLIMGLIVGAVAAVLAWNIIQQM